MIYTEMRDGKLEKYQYESKRKGKILCVTISPFKHNGQITGFIQSIVVK